MTRVSLDQLRIRVAGVPRSVLDAAMEGIGEALAGELSRLPAPALPRRSAFYVRLAAGEIADPADAVALRATIARHVAAGLTGASGAASAPATEGEDEA